MVRLCRPLSDLTRDDLALAGGKAANLGELIGAGFDVPPGFVVTTDAYRLAVGPLQPTRAAIAAAPIPDAVETAIREAYRSLGEGPVAVRSSATAEDLPGATFAGQQDSFLNVIGADAVVAGVRGCWASLWTDRAISYRSRLGIPDDAVAMAVVVQTMVDAEWAGVMFTAHPVTGARDRVVVESNPGLGESVVSGAVTPDHAVVGPDGAVVDRRIGHRESVVLPAAGGGTTTARGDRGVHELPDAILRRLAEQGRRAAGHFGAPQDIEWALAGDAILLTQSRPMTALPPAPIRLSRVQRLTGPVVLELSPRRPLPMELTAWIELVVFPHLERLTDAIVGVRMGVADSLLANDGVLRELVPPSPRPTRRTPARLVRTFVRAARHRAKDWRLDPRWPDIVRRGRELQAFPVKRATWAELTAIPHRASVLAVELAELRGRYLPAGGRALAVLSLILPRLGAPEGAMSAALGATTDTMRANAALEALAEIVRSNAALARDFSALSPAELVPVVEALPRDGEFRTGLDALMAGFGHRETGSILLPMDPSWGDSPSTVLGLVQVLARQPAGESRDEGSGAIAVLELPRVRRLRLGRPLRSLLSDAREGIGLREDTHFELVRTMPAVRRAVLEMGRRMALQGAIDEPEDAWFLVWSEVDRLPDPANHPVDGSLRDAIARRKRAAAALSGAPLIASSTLYPRRPSGEALAAGMPGGGGLATGAVRVIRNQSEFPTLRPGEVLVCPATNPSWTPLFAVAAAVVVDHGGPASHAAIVAREYGLPAVLGVGDGTSTLATGRRVTVDGDHGLVLAAEDTPGG